MKSVFPDSTVTRCFFPAVSLGGEPEVLLRQPVLAELLGRQGQQLIVRQLALVPLQDGALGWKEGNKEIRLEH